MVATLHQLGANFNLHSMKGGLSMEALVTVFTSVGETRLRPGIEATNSASNSVE